MVNHFLSTRWDNGYATGRIAGYGPKWMMHWYPNVGPTSSNCGKPYIMTSRNIAKLGRETRIRKGWQLTSSTQEVFNQVKTMKLHT